MYYELDALFGHDTFLLDVAGVGAAVKGHLEQVSPQLANASSAASGKKRNSKRDENVQIDE